MSRSLWQYVKKLTDEDHIIWVNAIFHPISVEGACLLIFGDFADLEKIKVSAKTTGDLESG
jgi:hypothetical protein